MNAHNCFPESWIGKEPVMVGDGSTYFIDNDSSKQINLPSNYKGIRAVWLNNGVLRIDTNMNNTKLFYVGYQRYFEAYQNETEPHDQYSYNEAVKECQRLRAEEAERNNPKRYSSSNDRKDKSENSNKTKGFGFGSMMKKNPFDKLSKEEARAISYLDDLEERRREEQWEREREEENERYFREQKKFRKSLGEGYYSKEPLQQLESIFEVYKNGGSEEMAFEFLKVVIEGDYDEKKSLFEKFVNQYKNNLQDIIPEEWAKKFLETFPYIYRYKYPELKCNEEDEPKFSNDDASESKGFFDFSTNRKNKKIESLKKDIKSQYYDYTSQKGFLRDNLINCEKTIREYKELIDSLNDTEMFLKSNSVGFFKSFTLSKEEKEKKKNAEEKKKQLKDKIQNKKEKIVRMNNEIKDRLEKVLKVEDKIKSDYSQLFELTNNIQYSQDFGVKGDGIIIAKQISKNVNKCDLDYYVSLFRI